MLKLSDRHESIYWWIPIENRKERSEDTCSWNPNEQSENKYSYNPKIHMKEWEILNVLNFLKDPEFMERCCEHYPDMTTMEIKKFLIDQQEDYEIYRIVHQHEWISKNVINKYVCRSKYFTEDLSEYIGNGPIKIIVDTPEIHDCNLIELTPELQEKVYWWYRWYRKNVSHLIDRKDFVWEDWKPLENKTSKLTVVAKVEKDYDDDKPYILIITAFWWEGKAKKEVVQDRYGGYECADLDDMEYWLNHALIVENNEKIERIWSVPGWIYEYNKKKKQKEIKSIYERWIDLKYQAFTNYVKNYLSDLWRKYVRLEVAQNKWNFLLENQWENKTVEWKQLILVNNWWKYWIIEVDDMDILKSYNDRTELEEYRKEILEKDYSQDFRANVIKDIRTENSDIPQQIVTFRKNFIKSMYWKNEALQKIIQSVEKIKHKVEIIDNEWSKLSTIILWDYEYKIFEPNLKNYSDREYLWNNNNVYLDWMRWDNLDLWLNKELAKYIKEKLWENFIIPWEEFDTFLSELWNEADLKDIESQVLMRRYLTWTDEDYWLSMCWNRRRKIKWNTIWSNVGNVSAKLMLMSVKHLKK